VRSGDHGNDVFQRSNISCRCRRNSPRRYRYKSRFIQADAKASQGSLEEGWDYADPVADKTWQEIFAEGADKDSYRHMAPGFHEGMLL
jgi:hypothetical protein